jgi:hypothetical protein
VAMGRSTHRTGHPATKGAPPYGEQLWELAPPPTGLGQPATDPVQVKVGPAMARTASSNRPRTGDGSRTAANGAWAAAHECWRSWHKYTEWKPIADHRGHRFIQHITAGLRDREPAGRRHPACAQPPPPTAQG